MRGVRKSRSPVDVSKPGHSKISLRKAAQDLSKLLAGSPPHEHVKRARSAFEDIARSKLRPILLTDQSHLCVYCEARVVDDPAQPPRVSHWEPLGQAPTQALEWKNLYLSCRSLTSCDEQQRGDRLVWNASDDSLPPPCNCKYERYLGFGKGGDVYVKKNASLTESQRRALELAIDAREDCGRKRGSLLGLNSPALIKARKQAIDCERHRLKTAFGEKDVGDEDRQAVADKLLAQSPLESFVSVRVAWWTRRLGKDRP